MTRRSGTGTSEPAGIAPVATTNGLPLAKARKRLEDAEVAAGTRRKRGRPKKVRPPRTRDNPEIVGQVAALRAEGIQPRRILRALGLADEELRAILKSPETQVEITKRRELLKGLTLRELGKTLLPAWELTQNQIEAGDPAGFNRAVWGLAALEKIGQSASGEVHRVEHSGLPTPQTTINIAEEIKQLIVAIRKEGEAP